MKLRIKDNTLRLRVSRSDLARLMATGRIESTIHFTGVAGEKWTYALETNQETDVPSLEYKMAEVTVIIPAPQAKVWSDTDQVGIYASRDLGMGERLELLIEKDFACLDLSDADNDDTFPNSAVEAAF